MKKSLIVTLTLALGLALNACGAEEEASTSAETERAGQRVEVTVHGSGYDPAEVQATAGEPLTLVFTRNTDEGCGQELVIASQDIRRELPLNEPVVVTFTPTEAGELRFTCGMDMYDGAIVVR
ncbi:MAG TPA: cupredoxin domain-containing protein [Sandaracinaceae bacterium LLY-WYZ-13_1]|nr:cupredoxin domain-containing protein [Sandaracinaceae bacterium LLY-WYZ-13_1]